MNLLYSKLKKVTPLNKEELFLYIFERGLDATIEIITNSGFTHSGCLVNYGVTRDEGKIIVLQISDNKGGFLDRVIHIAINKIETVTLNNNKNILDILSKGEIKDGVQYEISGKLEVKREVQQLTDTILKTYNLNIGVPDIILPEDGLQLNRILKNTRIIFQSITELLKEQDALASWKKKYNSIAFTDYDVFEINGKGSVLTIYFPFNNLNAPLIDEKEMTLKLMSVL